jgi:hypothetical protein
MTIEENMLTHSAEYTKGFAPTGIRHEILLIVEYKQH